MANAFTKQEMVMFDEVLEGFDDMLIIAKGVEKYIPTSAQNMERSNDRIWRPQPYITPSYDGFDQSSNFGDMTQLAVPVGLGKHKSVPGKMTAKDLRDPSQLEKIGTGAKQKLTSDINSSLMSTACLYGSVVSKRSSAASGFDDVADCDALFTEQGVDTADRLAFYSSRDYNKMAGNLASRVLDNSKSLNAYEKAFVGEVSGFDTFKNDQNYYLAAATATTVKVNGANQYYVPVSHTTDADGNTTNVDNRFQNITISVGGSTVKVGDAFTIANVNAVHHITKQDTGQLKTFRIVGIVSGAGGSGIVTITPPIISAGGGSRAELQYQNVTATPADQAPITFLNTIRATVNPFFIRKAIELIPGSFAVEPDAGWSVMTGTTELGVQLTYVRQGLIGDLSMNYRWDVDWGTGALNTEMMGIQMFSQT